LIRLDQNSRQPNKKPKVSCAASQNESAHRKYSEGLPVDAGDPEITDLALKLVHMFLKKTKMVREDESPETKSQT